MRFITLLDLVSLFAVAATLAALLRFHDHKLDRGTFLLLVTFLAVLLFRDVSNVLKWTGAVPGVDALADYVELISPMMWGFLFYALLQQAVKRGLLDEVRRRVKAQRALRDSEARYRLLVENQRDLIIKLDAEMRLTFASPSYSRTFGVTDEETLGRSFTDVIHPEDFGDLQMALENLSHPPHTCQHEGRLITAEGVRWFEWSCNALVDARGRISEIVATGRDITSRKQAEEERRRLEDRVQHAQKLESLGVLAGGIAHDFNNILMTIIGNADLALEDMPPASPARQSVAEIMQAGQRAADLCRQMLAYSGKGRFELVNLDLSEAVTEMKHMLEVSISKKAVLKYDLAEKLPAIEADPNQVRQVVMNLITNASEAIGNTSGVIAIHTGAAYCSKEELNNAWTDEDIAEGLYVVLEVSDTGAGMDEETMAKIFDPFFSTKFTGRGLGLAAVLGIARGHRGTLSVQSEPGKGSRFRVLFPAVEDPATSLARPADGREAWRGAGTVLLVDDEETIRALGTRILQRMAFTVRVAADGREALALFRENMDAITCVILDLTMPHMDGEETFHELQKLKPGLPVILASGYDEHQATQRFLGKGPAAFIQKPFQSLELAEKIRDVLASRVEDAPPQPAHE